MTETARADAKSMTCEHLKELYRTCEQHNLKLSSSDLIRIVCPHCGVQEVCPSIYSLEYEQRELQTEEKQEEAES